MRAETRIERAIHRLDWIIGMWIAAIIGGCICLSMCVGCHVHLHVGGNYYGEKHDAMVARQENDSGKPSTQPAFGDVLFGHDGWRGNMAK